MFVEVQKLKYCQFSIWQKLVINKYFLMSSKVQTHRRNMAQEHDEDSYRMSVPVSHINAFRNSYDIRVEPKPQFRASDMTILSMTLGESKKKDHKKQKQGEKQDTQKTPRNLLSTLQLLTLKLVQAKKQLQSPKGNQLSQFSFEINACKLTESNGGLSVGDSIFEKMDESTINLQSQKKLINVVRSKQRLIWANRIKTYYVAQVARGIVGINERALEHLTISLEILKSCQHMNLPDEKTIKRLRVQLPLTAENASKKVLVLDMDETLIHCEETRMSEDDIQIDIPIENAFQKAYVSIRPYAISFLKKASKNFEIIVFTASQKCYADVILNEMDPQGEYIHHRLYREHCVRLHNKVYSKDLSIINRDLSRMVLVDNSPFSYLYQIQNGIPILPYYGGEDSELLSLQRYLQQLRKERDVRNLNMRTFKLPWYGEYNSCEELVKDLYCSDEQSY